MHKTLGTVRVGQGYGWEAGDTGWRRLGSVGFCWGVLLVVSVWVCHWMKCLDGAALLFVPVLVFPPASGTEYV